MPFPSLSAKGQSSGVPAPFRVSEARPAQAGKGITLGEQGATSACSIIIEDGVTIGAGAVIMAKAGVPRVVGSGAVIGANSTITGSVPPGAVKGAKYVSIRSPQADTPIVAIA